MPSDRWPELADDAHIQQQRKETSLIREVQLADAEAVAQLTAELGYPTEAAVMRERIAMMVHSQQHTVYVACVSMVVVGWIDVSIAHHLSSGTYGEIGGFIVSSEYRNRGIGQRLIRRAEQWVRDQGATRMVVRSRTAREAAHRFYVREGYSLIKTSAVFGKQLMYV